MDPFRVFPVLLLLAFSCTPLLAGEKEFYVSPLGKDAQAGTLAQPFRTVERARDAVRALRREGKLAEPVTVYLREGIYALSRPLAFFPEDGGSATSPITYRAYENERPLISGGRPVTGWKVSRRGEREVWTAAIPEVRSGQLYFRELWANGARRIRARHPNKGYLKVLAVPEVTPKPLWSDGSMSFQFSPGDIPADWTYADAQTIVMNRWTESHLPISRIDTQGQVIHFSKRSVFTLDKGDDYYMENVPEAMDYPGEWHLDVRRGELQYIPMPGEEIGTTGVIIPVLQQLLRLEGDPETGKFIEHMAFEGITFSHCEWNLPDTLNFRITFNMADSSALAGVHDGGYPQAAYGVPGAVYGKGARNVTFDRCEIAHVGSYGIELSRGCQHNRILRCVLTDLGAGGVKIGETIIRPAASDRTGRNDVIECSISEGGLVYHSAIGVWVAQSADNRIMHNTIHDFYYSGFSLGWTWGYGPSAARGNIVENNHVHHIGVRSNGDGPILSDMAGIYTLGIQPGTVIRRNIFHDIAGVRYGGWGIYFDEGSTDILAEDNLVYRTTHGGFHQHYGKNNIVRNNIFAFARDYQIQRSRAEGHLSFTFEGNIIYWKEGKAAAGNFSGSNFRMENNIYWKEGGGEALFDSLRFSQWQSRGLDLKSTFVDPGFENPGGGDFSFKKDSPALKRGFRPFQPGPHYGRSGLHLEGVGAQPSRADSNGNAAERRLLYNMDGTDLFFYHDTMSPAELCWRVDEVADAGVTTYLFSPNPGQNMGYPSVVCDMFQYTFADTPGTVRPTGSDSIFARIAGNMAHLVKHGYDPTGIVVDRARLRNLETFLTFRMNELHDVDVPGSPLLSRFWKDHPEYRVGGYEGWGAYALNYAEPEVRKYYFSLLEEVCSKFDIDGLELDFMRFPYYFPNDSLKRKEYGGIMTAFVRRVHTMMEARARERGRPLLLTARVPSTLKSCAFLGLDPASWAREHLIDFLTVGPFLSTEVDIPVREFKRACPGIPVYASIEYTLGEQPMTPEITRAAAASLYASGADGIYSFNHFCQREFGAEDFGVFPEISRPEALAGKNKLYAMSAARYPVLNVSMPSQLPVTVGAGEQREVILRTAEASTPGAITLRIEADSTVSGDRLRLEFNGRDLQASPGLIPGVFPDRFWRGRAIPSDRCVEYSIDPSFLRERNRIVISSSQHVEITWVYLATQY